MGPVVMICRFPHTDDDERQVLIGAVNTSRPAVMLRHENGRVTLAAEFAGCTYIKTGGVQPPV